MHDVMKGIEEVGRVFLMNGLFSYAGIMNNSKSALWNGLFTYSISKGYSPFKSGAVAGYLAGDSSKYVTRSIRGGVSGVGVSLSSRVGHYLVNKWKHK
ncbi:hypothetical protein NEMIN01_1681 [Nematocida minor]|uniref:uncharacterized protein n=1 Tax=Nematocida minor TaxID=1912983 RepID=UPI0022202CDC|nr:uncharacterized protein NEMIN01_1681 [Nematocida minor]KAI5191826.1 hypothetical protein NEMIN01_1681 [Nematocida minor]